MANKNNCIDEIQHLLITKTYKPSKYIEKTIKEGSKQKERKISIPKFYPDQIIQWAVLLQTIPYFSKGMYVFTCGSVPNKGTSYAKRYVGRWLHNDFKGTRYCLKLDVHHFYQSINHGCLKETLKHKFKDEKLLKLFYLIIDSVEEGLPIGNVTSQWLANFYLQGLDHYIKEKLHAKYYVRYMDDMVILGSNKRKLGKMKVAIEQYLNNIGLELNSKWQKFKTDSRGIDFLGYRFFHYKTILRRSIMLRISRKVRKVYKKKSYSKHNCMSIISYLGWIKHSNSYKLYQKWIKPYINVKRMKGVIRRENFKYGYAKQSV